MDNLTKDSLIDFFKEPTLENFSEFFEKNIGETNNVDFKGKWIDIDKIAQIALGIANCGGGCIIIGVEVVLCQYFGHKKSNFFMLHF